MESSRWRLFSIFMMPALAGCAGDAEVHPSGQRWPDTECHRLGEDFQVDPVLSVDAALRVFRNQILPDARDTGRSFPGYNQWLDEVAEAIRRHEVTDAPTASAAAQPEFDLWVSRVDVPRRDAMTRAAIREQTNFAQMARNLTKRMRCQADERRVAAIDHLRSTYFLRR